mmetsp:Transcript_65982/g.117542  ORF Transcript_65982/g.117542 Transcript_65982/m.117542 type:complete len:87 (+) Transcript_65982:396-656(+)
MVTSTQQCQCQGPSLSKIVEEGTWGSKSCTCGGEGQQHGKWVLMIFAKDWIELAPSFNQPLCRLMRKCEETLNLIINCFAHLPLLP